MVGSLFGRSLGLIGETLIVRHLRPEIYGDISFVYTLVAALSNVILLGIHEGLTRLGSAEEEPGERLNIILAGTTIVLISSFLVTVALITVPGVISKFASEPSLDQYIYLVAPFLILYPLSRIAIAVLRIQERTAITVLTKTLLARVVSIGLLVIAIMLGWKEGAGALYWLSVPFTITVVGGFFAITEMEVTKIQLPRPNQYKKLWTFSLPLALSSVVFLFLSQLDILMVGYYLDSKAVGYYRSIQPLRQVTMIFVGSFSFLFLPLATQYYEQNKLGDLDKLFSTVTKWGVILTLPLVLVFLYASKSIVQTLFGPAYQAAAMPLAILAGGLFYRALVGPNGDVVKAINSTRIELYAAIAGISSNFICNILLIPSYGISGAAVATVIGYVIYNTVELGIIYSETGVTPFSSNIMKPVIVSFVGMGIIRYLMEIGGSIQYLILFGIISTVMVVTSVILTNSVEETDMVLLDRLESRVGRQFGTVHRVLKFGMQ